jgi:U32 family peptidase
MGDSLENPQFHKPEIMSPAGHWPQLHAAIEAGADAVYFGLTHFSARAKVGFTLAELPDVISALHRRGVKGYLTFNTLVFDHELSDAAHALAQIAAMGVDALIVQDIGIARLAHAIAPEVAIHGSTQMSITSAEGVELARRFGVSRVVLARELSLDEVRAIRGQTTCELEMFVHGALCVSYSGQCFSSEAWGGRSANRGQCAQACRLPYDLIVDDVVRPLGDKRYLLSPGDLYTLQQIPEIVRLGVSALKIEGRYKDAEYVALTTAAYRKAVDEAWDGLPLSSTRAEEAQLGQIYSRGLGPWFVTGTNHQVVVDGRSPRHRGLLMGRVAHVERDGVVVDSFGDEGVSPLKPGDGIVFDSAAWRSPQEAEEGGRVYQVLPRRGRSVALRFANGAIIWERIRPGDLVWRTSDPDVEHAARFFTEAQDPISRQGVDVRLRAAVGAPLRIEWILVGHPHVSVVVETAEPLVEARTQGLDEQFAREQLGRLGGTPYDLTSLTADIEGKPFAPSSVLNHLRREAVGRLSALQSRPVTRSIGDPQAILDAALRTLPEEARAGRPGTLPLDKEPSLHLLVRRQEQLDAAIEARPASITLDYLELYGLRPSVERVQDAGLAVRVASPRVLKPNEQRIINFLLRLEAPILVRSTGLLHALQGVEHLSLFGDSSLNAANAITARTLLRLDLERLAPTHDLNGLQVAELAREVGPLRVEVICYQHLPVFHTEHCVFCRFLSQGTSYKDCGHPCEQHRLGLKDPAGRIHPVLADVGCRNTVFGAEAQEASDHLQSWRDAGIRHWRLEFAHESARQVAEVAALWRAALEGSLRANELARRLRSVSPQGTTEGSLFVPANFAEIRLEV